MNSLRDYLKTALLTLQYSFGELLTSNVLWVLMLLPIVTIPPAFAGLFYATSRLAHQESVTWRTFFEGFRRYFRASYFWFLSNVIVPGGLLFNINLTMQAGEVWSQVLAGVYLGMIVLWMLLQVYTFPLIIEQEQPRLLQALRNSMVLWLKHLRFSLFLAFILSILVVISYYAFPFWFIITGSFLAYLANLGLVYLLSRE